jgi:hypothetical protein
MAAAAAPASRVYPMMEMRLSAGVNRQDSTMNVLPVSSR